ncbi:phenyltransferase domain-containing protein [Desulfosarcina ovata]|uniref:Prenyltransferase n=1 Tax=Desulfosarcina ovata subsp. ovata TaxID=2752305 RepID=A0A5K8ABW5_9BACT|nr:phenyltransferase domain-containing protein [Desulfosarcina ovata]BBO89996.1 prenyltransferase [Desulfosarcina ovata subsp. ovata]
MNMRFCKQRRQLAVDVDAVSRVIAATQLASGEIPWSPGDKTDPWDHVEAAMGLVVGGYFEQARHAFSWLRTMQLSDGSWFSAYRQGVPADRTRDTNMSAYIAVGVWHYWLVTGDGRFLESMWETVRRAIDFALRHQRPGGEIAWAISPQGRLDPMALLTGCSSIYMSLKCALATAAQLAIDVPAWATAYHRLGEAIRHRPTLFNMTKSRFSMDWFYPVLCGAVTGQAAHRRIDRQWKKYVVEGLGVRCVSDQPWVTIAESAELVLALSAMGDMEKANIVFSWLSEHVFEDSSFWCGFTFPDMTLWPEEKIAWTNAVVLLAADALFGLTPAAHLFSHAGWDQK